MNKVRFINNCGIFIDGVEINNVTDVKSFRSFPENANEITLKFLTDNFQIIDKKDYEKMDIIKAQKEIAGILKQLEHDSGCIIKNLYLDLRDVTKVSDNCIKYKMSVRIDVDRHLSHEWNV